MEFEVTATVVFRVSYVVDRNSAMDRVRAIPERDDGDLPRTVKIVRIVNVQGAVN